MAMEMRCGDNGKLKTEIHTCRLCFELDGLGFFFPFMFWPRNNIFSLNLNIKKKIQLT